MGAGEYVDDQHGRQYRMRRVLLAQGDDEWGAELRRWLTGAGFEASVCTTRSTLVEFDREQPDLVLLASAVGQDEAVGVCRWIRARSSVPIVVAAARSARIDVVQLLTSGADLVLPATIGERELVARVRAVLRGRPPRPTTGDPARPYGGLRLDRGAGVLHVDHGELPLEDRQLQLMALLLQTAPRVTPRAAARELLKVDDSTLDGLVRRLRERLEAVEGWRRIVAIRRVGFRLLAERPVTASAPACAPVVVHLDAEAAVGEAVLQLRDHRRPVVELPAVAAAAPPAVDGGWR